MIVTTYCTAQSLILQLISSDELLVLLWVSVIEVTVGAGGGPACIYLHSLYTVLVRRPQPVTSVGNIVLQCANPYLSIESH